MTIPEEVEVESDDEDIQSDASEEGDPPVVHRLDDPNSDDEVEDPSYMPSESEDEISTTKKRKSGKITTVSVKKTKTTKINEKARVVLLCTPEGTTTLCNKNQIDLTVRC